MSEKNERSWRGVRAIQQMKSREVPGKRIKWKVYREKYRHVTFHTPIKDQMNGDWGKTARVSPGA